MHSHGKYDIETEAIELLDQMLDIFHLSPTSHQYKALHHFALYYLSDIPREVFILKGYAGTGKTTIIDTLVKFLRKNKYETVLLAPTGRAAKVITKKTRRYASTIHRHIYSTQESTGGQLFFTRKVNDDAKRTIYIVDEASMLGDLQEGAKLFQASVLGDFLSFAFEGHDNRKVIFVGDNAQLPPVGASISPALNAEYLEKKFRVKAREVEMSEVKRQALDSGILLNANKFRALLDRQGLSTAHMVTGKDVEALENGFNAIELFYSEFDREKMDKISVITYSNFRATAINKAIRNMIYDFPEGLMEGDIVMVVKNNYAWPEKNMPFIANGEMGVIRKVYRETIEEKYGLSWGDVDIDFEDVNGENIEIHCKVVLSLLESNEPAVKHETMLEILHERKRMVQEVPLNKKGAKLKKDPYVNALQIKYGYAVTGHKSQGGQWEQVIIAFEPQYPGVDFHDYLRWTYTAVTRAEKKLYLLACPFLGEETAIFSYRNDFKFLPELLENESWDEEERALIEEYGQQLIALLNGKLPANTEARRRLIRVANNEVEPKEPVEFALLFYISLYEQQETSGKGRAASDERRAK